MWDIWEKRTEEEWVKDASKLTKEVLDTARTWISFILAAAAVEFLAVSQNSIELRAASIGLQALAVLTLVRFFLWEMGVRNVIRRRDRLGVAVDIAANFLLFVLSYLVLSGLTGRLVDAAVSMRAA